MLTARATLRTHRRQSVDDELADEVSMLTTSEESGSTPAYDDEVLTRVCAPAQPNRPSHPPIPRPLT